MLKKVLTSILFLSLIGNSLLFTGCGQKSPTEKLALYTANADAGLVAVTDSIDRLYQAGRVSAGSAKNIYQINLKLLGAIDLVRDRAKVGYRKPDVLTILKTSIEDARRAEAEGVINLTGKDRETFLKVTFFLQFSIQSIQAIVEATKEPTVPADQLAQAAAGSKGIKSFKLQDETLWTDLVLILQTAVLRGISQSRMSADEAFADGLLLSKQLKESLNAKLSSLIV